MSATRMHGHVDPRFAPIREMLDGFLVRDPSLSAQLCVHVRGERVIDLVGGESLDHDSVTGVYSATKGIAALTIARLLDSRALALDAPVAEHWPEFADAGKDRVTVGDLLSHRAGLPILDDVVPLDELTSSAPAAARLAAQLPLWVPGTAFGYHGITIGILIEELVRRVEGRELRDAHEAEIRAPRDADFFIGLPASEDHRYVDVRPMRPTEEQAAELASRPQGDPVLTRMFANFEAGDEWSESGVSTNNPDVRRAGPAGIGGVGSARGLARLYSDALPGAERPIASQETFAAMRQMRSWGIDRTLGVPNAFGTVFMVPQPRQPFGSHRAFGHDGGGGALAFADPETGVAFGYIPVPMQYPGGADPRAVAIAREVRALASA
ncbi:serine hydrolase domain-containing protein [Demequina sp. SYSU T00192]|uniref:Serine hydrolase domain-containing protein n=1 Tax=Demequina litoralis TaxID=3051660 RepID=A0ABT8GCE5_9MICO|nr:serine hydrolase domain-containing protein [Demequina sp. SYSU T00192]MDN4476804.1 serine hydrolase domain-containing protein [Demequina sp. SYSU T00192]